jgi:hypothetical protein
VIARSDHDPSLRDLGRAIAMASALFFAATFQRWATNIRQSRIKFLTTATGSVKKLLSTLSNGSG